MNCKSVMMLIFFLSFRHPFREVNSVSDSLAPMGRCCNQTLSAIIYSYPLGIEATSNEGAQLLYNASITLRSVAIMICVYFLTRVMIAASPMSQDIRQKPHSQWITHEWVIIVYFQSTVNTYFPFSHNYESY